LGLPANAFVVGFIGRLVRDKGIVELSTAWQDLREQFPEMRLLIVGPIEPDDPVPAEVLQRLRSDDRVILHGVDWNTPPLFAAMDLFVLPSYREGFPIAPLEASAMGLPVIATQVPGCVDSVQEGVTGTLVPAGDAAALFSAIARYRNDPELRNLHGQAGRARVVREFRQEPIWEAVLGEYLQLLSIRRLDDSRIQAAKQA
jgi:glycosyltransferase involved in cell wall biosynthesis